ncbi:hypothetical protein EDB81DRAFT_897363 [Dactylonectria macrodidyma]|uniref:Rhodopsin domain-containing protein n=1 Tax=Dactylonectria macrodidyma TaxID=307937 RepID=A0A9P9FU29_9HYPO|nr:hypothetical protein EDB81DRAFT_897363 [Dactylonectria macrodidyma]
MGKSSPQDDDTDIGPRTLAILLAGFVLCLLLYASRIYTHLVPKRRLKTPDFLISLAVVLEIPVLVLLGLAITKGLGRPSYYISPEAKTEIKYYQFWLSVLAIWVAYLARMSTACLLLQFDPSIQWRIVLYAFIFIQIAAPFSFNLAQFLRCSPLHAMWEHMPDAKCWTQVQSNFFFYIVVIGTAAVSDATFAIMPILFIWKLSRPRIERVLVIILMAMGLCALATVIVRSVNTGRRGSTKDAMRNTIFVITMCRVEDFILIAAACAPFLKGPLERCIHSRFGVPVFHNVPRDLSLIRSSPHGAGGNSSNSMQADCSSESWEERG